MGFSCSARHALGHSLSTAEIESLTWQVSYSSGLEDARDVLCLSTLSCQPALSFCRSSGSPHLGAVPGCSDQNSSAGARGQLFALPLVSSGCITLKEGCEPRV